MQQTIYLLVLLLGCLTTSIAQIGIGGQPDPSAVLDLKSPANNKAFYPPRLTTAQRLAIPDPQAGAMVFDSDKATLFLYDGQNWLPLAVTTSNTLPLIDRVASDGLAGDQFGSSVAISGDYAIVGAPTDDINSSSNQGSAYIFVRSGNAWTQQAKLTANDGATDDFFGLSVAISGDYALVGAERDDIGIDTDQGSAYVFVRSGTTWTQQAKLTANDGLSNDLFGRSVSISGDYALIGAYSDNIGSNTSQGSAYVFVRSGTTWTQQAKLTANDGAANDRFGNSVALSSNYALIGTTSDDIGSNTDQGSAYVFVRSGTTWTQQDKLTADAGAAFDYFGCSVAISGNYAVIGAYGEDVSTGISNGAAYVFVRSGTSWSQQSRLTAFDSGNDQHFGFSVAISGDYAVIGAPNNSVNTLNYQGSAYVFMRSGTSWLRVRKVTELGSGSTQNGYSVGLSNGTFVIGRIEFQNSKGKVGFGTVD